MSAIYEGVFTERCCRNDSSQSSVTPELTVCYLLLLRVGKAARLSIYYHDTAYPLIIPQQQVELSQLYKYHHLSQSESSIQHCTPGGTQIWIGQGCAAGSSKPIPMFRGNFSKNMYPYFRDFSDNTQNFLTFPMVSYANPGKF